MGADVSATAREEKIQKNPAAIQFSPQQPANTYRHRCQVLCINQKIQSTGAISEKFTLTQEIFSSPSNTSQNHIISFHPGFLQWILCKKNSEVSQKRKVPVRKGQWSNYHKRELISFSESCDNQASLAQKLHCLVTSVSSLFWKINLPIGKERPHAKDNGKYCDNCLKLPQFRTERMHVRIHSFHPRSYISCYSIQLQTGVSRDLRSKAGDRWWVGLAGCCRIEFVVNYLELPEPTYLYSAWRCNLNQPPQTWWGALILHYFCLSHLNLFSLIPQGQNFISFLRLF